MVMKFRSGPQEKKNKIFQIGGYIMILDVKNPKN
jgi:hypothetical protein